MRKIFSYLDPFERIRMNYVCSKWYKILSDPQSWEYLNCHPIFTDLNPTMFTHFCKQSGEALMSVNLDSCWKILDDDLGLLAANCPNISHLSISNCWKISDKGLSYLAVGLPNVKSIDTSYCAQLNGSGFLDHRWTSLRSINLTYCKQIGDEQLEKILCRTVEVQHIQLRRCSRITDFGVFLVVRYCR
jgi:hypothetical protein